MNEWGIYIALYCVLLYTQSTLQSCVTEIKLNIKTSIINFN